MSIKDWFTSRSHTSGDDKKIACVIDVGSGSVGAALVVFAGEKRPLITQGARYGIPEPVKKNFDGYVEAVTVAVEHALKALEHDMLVRVSRVDVFLSSPWFAGEARTVQFSFEREVKCTEQLLREAGKREGMRFFEYARDMYAEFMGGDEMELFEAKRMQVKLNGYRTMNPYGKTARHIEMGMFFSVCSRSIADTVRGVVQNVLDAVPLELHSFSSTLFAILRDWYGENKNYVYLDISAEMTDIGIVRDEMIAHTTMFPIGRRAFWHTIENTLRATRDDALSRYRMYVNQELEAKEARKVTLALKKFRHVWLEAFSESLHRVNVQLIPHVLYVTADPDMAYWVQSILQNDDTIDIFGGVPPKVIPLEASMLAKYCDFALEVRKDPFLIIEATFVHKLLRA